MSTKIKFIVIAVRHRDTYGNTYHSARITRTDTGAVVKSEHKYGYDSAYMETAYNAMKEAGWIKFAGDIYDYERANPGAIHYECFDMKKRDCLANIS